MNKRGQADTRSEDGIVVPIIWKMLATTVVVGGVAAAIAVFGLQRIHALNERLTRTVDVSVEKVKLAESLKRDLVTVTREEKNLLLAPSDKEASRYVETIDQTLASMRIHQDRLRSLSSDDDLRQLDKFADRWKEWQDNHGDVRYFAQLNTGAQARQLSLGKGQEAFIRFEAALASLAELYVSQLKSADRDDESGSPPEALREQLMLIVELLKNATEMQRLEKQFILAPSEEESNRYDKELDPLQARNDIHFDYLRKLAGSPENAQIESADAAIKEYLAILSEIRSLVGQKGSFFVQEFAYARGVPLAVDAELVLDQIIEHNEKELDDYRDDSNQTYRYARNGLLAISAAGVIISVAFSFFTGQRIARNLNVLANYAQQVQDTGDLSRPVPAVSRDEVGRLAAEFDRMRVALHRHATERAALNETLEQKSEEMEQFVYTVSHDLKSPLVSCKGLVGLIKEDIAAEDYDEVRDSANRLDEATDQLSQIIDDLLSLSRIGRKSVELSEIDVGSLVRKLREELSDRLGEAGATLEIQDRVPTIVADAKDVRRVFENLLINALKYGCDSGNGAIVVGGEKRGANVRYFVRDKGRGIAAEFHDRIFGLFQRLDTKKPGTGVGLASVAKIMRTHGGRVWVESALGKGATFWLEFPVLEIDS